MEKIEHQERQVEKPQSVLDGKDGVDLGLEPSQHIHLKTIILLIAVVGVYFAQVVHLVGAGFLANTITSVVGGQNQATWFASTIAIATATLGPPVSQAADYWGRKWFVLILTLVGCIGCIIVSRAHSIGMAIGGQAVSALAIACQPIIHAIASEILPRKYRPLAQSCTNTSAALAGIVGLLSAGALTAHNPNGFRTYWYMTAGMYAASALIIVLLYHPPVRELQVQLSTRQKLARLDWVGYFLLITGLVLFSYSLTASISIYPWKSAHILGPFMAGVALLFAFFIYEWKFTRSGMLHHDLFSRGRNFIVAELCILIEGMVFFSANNYFGFEVVVLYGFNQFKAGLYYSVAWYCLIISTTTAGIYCSRTKTVRVPTMIAFGFFVLFNALMASLSLSTQNNAPGYAVFMGLGLGTALNALVVVAQLSTPPELISITTGLMIATRSFGGTVALSIDTAIFSNTLSSKIPAKVTAATIPLGLKPAYLGELIGSLTTKNTTALAQIPGITPKIIAAAGTAIKKSYSLGFRYIWVTAAAFSALALIGAFFLIDPKAEFTSHIDAPIETEEELRKPGKLEKFHVEGGHA